MAAATAASAAMASSSATANGHQGQRSGATSTAIRASRAAMGRGTARQSAANPGQYRDGRLHAASEPRPTSPVTKTATRAKRTHGGRRMAKEELLEFDGMVTEVLPDGNFRVKLDNDHEILAYTAGKMRKFRIRTGVGDRVWSRCRLTTCSAGASASATRARRRRSSAPVNAARNTGARRTPRRAGFRRARSRGTGGARAVASRTSSNVSGIPARLASESIAPLGDRLRTVQSTSDVFACTRILPDFSVRCRGTSRRSFMTGSNPVRLRNTLQSPAPLTERITRVLTNSQQNAGLSARQIYELKTIEATPRPPQACP